MKETNLEAQEYLSTEKAAEYSGLSKSHVQGLLLKGKIKGMRIGKIWVTTAAAIDAYLATDPRPGPQKIKLQD